MSFWPGIRMHSFFYDEESIMKILPANYGVVAVAERSKRKTYGYVWPIREVNGKNQLYGNFIGARHLRGKDGVILLVKHEQNNKSYPIMARCLVCVRIVLFNEIIDKSMHPKRREI